MCPCAMGFFAPPHQEAFDSPIVTFKQGDLSRDAAVAKRLSSPATDSPRRSGRSPQRGVAKGSGVTKGARVKKGKRRAAG